MANMGCGILNHLTMEYLKTRDYYIFLDNVYLLVLQLNKWLQKLYLYKTDNETVMSCEKRYLLENIAWAWVYAAVTAAAANIDAAVYIEMIASLEKEKMLQCNKSTLHPYIYSSIQVFIDEWIHTFVQNPKV